MKKYILLFLLLSISLGAGAQSRSFRALSDKYSGKDGFTVVEMSGDMLKAINSSGKKSSSGNIPLNNISNMVIIVSEKNTSAFFDDVNAMLAKGGYSELSAVNSGGSSVSFYAMKSGGEITEILMLVCDGNDNVIMSVTGKGLSIDQIAGKLDKFF